MEKEEEEVIQTRHTPPHSPADSLGLCHPSACGQLETGAPRPLSSPTEATLETEHSLPAAAPHSQASRPHPHLISALLPKMGALEQRSSFLLPLRFPPYPHPPCRGSQENDLSCWGGGWGRSWRLSSARTLTHTHTLRHTAAARRPLPSASLQRHLPSCLLGLGSLPPTQAPLLLKRVPLPQEKPLSKEKERQVRVQERKTGLYPRPEKEGGIGYKPCVASQNCSLGIRLRT